MVKSMSSNDSYRLMDRRSDLALSPTLMLGIGLLVLLAVGSVLLVQWVTGRAMIQEFASRLIARNLYTTELALRRHLDAAVHQANFIAESMRGGRYDFADPSLEDFIAGTIAAAPQIYSVFLVDPAGKALRLGRDAPGTNYDLKRLDITEDRQLADTANEIRTHSESYWGAPIYRDVLKATFLNYRVPLRQGNIYLGFIAIAVSTEALSALAAELSNPPDALSFMLYGRDGVLAHPAMVGANATRSQDMPLPTLQVFGDPVVTDLHNLPRLGEAGIEPPPGTDARQVSVDGKRYFVFTREVLGYGGVPITVGGYVLASAVDAPLKLFYWAILIGLALLVASLTAAALIASMISRPIRRAAGGAIAIGALDFDKVAFLSQGYFREINDLARSFNSMLNGLKAFGRYVPRTLVMRLVKEGGLASASQERELAIMFTDIAGFTATCENMTASEVADFLNHHLALVSKCVEAESGTIDKYIGDAVMAFWGAPNRVENPAECACRAAIAIRNTTLADNNQRVARGLKPIHIRIGIHFGPVVVGDIGAPNRINYTIVGDTVNAAQRLESLGKVIDREADAVVLISREIFESLPAGLEVIDRGIHSVKGKREALKVYQLLGERL
jgi:adenylate cyclase